MTMPKQRFTADLDAELYKWLMKYKDEKKISRNAALAEAVELLKKEIEKSQKRG